MCSFFMHLSKLYTNTCFTEFHWITHWELTLFLSLWFLMVCHNTNAEFDHLIYYTLSWGYFVLSTLKRCGNNCLYWYRICLLAIFYEDKEMLSWRYYVQHHLFRQLHIHQMPHLHTNLVWNITCSREHLCS